MPEQGGPRQLTFLLEERQLEEANPIATSEGKSDEAEPAASHTRDEAKKTGDP